MRLRKAPIDTSTVECGVQVDKESELKAKVEDQVARLPQSHEKATRRIEQLKEQMAAPMQDDAADGHRARVTALEVRLALTRTARCVVPPPQQHCPSVARSCAAVQYNRACRSF